MRLPGSLPIAAAAVVLALIGACGGPAPAPETTCTGPSVDKADPVERLPFHADLDPACSADTAPAELSATQAHVFGSEQELLDSFSCASGSVDVDFANEEVLVLDRLDTVDVDGVFAVGANLVVATSASETCHGAGPLALRSVTVLQRTGDVDVAVRACTTTDPSASDLQCP